MNLCVPIPMLRPLPCSVNPAGGEPKENARSQAALSRVFKSFLPALPRCKRPRLHASAHVPGEPALLGLGEGAVPKLSHKKAQASAAGAGDGQAPNLINLHADRSPSLPPATSTPSHPRLCLLHPDPSPHLEQLPGEVSAFIEALQVSDEVSAGHALPNVLSEGIEACEGDHGPQTLKSLDAVCFLGSLPLDPHSHGRGDRC